MSQELRSAHNELLIESEMKEAYLTFAMSVIVSRALPDARDGLKPVQRRILVGMDELNLGPRSKTRKCGKIVGDVIGNYHPHGDMATYDALVRMAQDFTMRYPLIDPQGNFGSPDGDPAAASRYTEARLSGVGAEMLRDLKQDTVDFVDNYDNTRLEPAVLPGRFPNLLANGASGIAVGMATSIPPHNLRELCDSIEAVLDNPEITIPEIMKIMPGPDLPTGGVLCGLEGIYEGYTTGRGTVTLRARTEVEEAKRRKRIVVTEAPWRMDRDQLVSKIAGAVQDGRVQDVSDIRNESDRDGTRLVIDLKTGADDQVVINQLFRHTPLQSTLSIMLIAIVDGKPETLNIKRALTLYVRHRRDVIRRRTAHQLARAEDRAHVLEGLRIAVINIDEVIEIIRDSQEVQEARIRLMNRFDLTERQVDAIIAMQLRSLVGLEQLKIEKEHEELLAKIADMKAILADPERVKALIREDLEELRERYGDERRTTISAEAEILEREDLIPEEDMVVTLTYSGYAKRATVDTFREQGRGGKGVIGADLKEEDFVSDLFVASTHDYIMFFTTKGLVYWLKVYMIPEMSRTSKGRALVNLLDLDQDEIVTGMVPVREFDVEDAYVCMATEKGKIKRTELNVFGKRGSGGIIAIKLADDDRLIGVRRTDGNKNLSLATRNGYAIRFPEDDVRPQGRVAGGVRGIKLRKGDRVVDLAVQEPQTTLLTVCENGYGKRTDFEEYSLQHRGGMGVQNIKTSKRNGPVVAARAVSEDEQLILITEAGMTVRTSVDSISCIGRGTQGVKIVTTKANDIVSGVAVVPPQDEEEEPEAIEEPEEELTEEEQKRQQFEDYIDALAADDEEDEDE
jgi:DNA gyrase subunit A